MRKIFFVFYLLVAFSVLFCSCKKIPTFPISGPGDSIFMLMHPFVFAWGTSGFSTGQFNQPHGVAVDGNGEVYVCDSVNNRIQKFDKSGNFLLMWGSGGSGSGQFNNPINITLDNGGNVYVADSTNYRVQKFNSVGAFIRAWGSQGNSGGGQFAFPWGVTTDGSGTIYVSDFLGKFIEKFDLDGNFITQWGGIGTFTSPAGICLNRKVGKIYVTDRSLNLVKVFDANGNPLGQWGSTGTGNGQFDWPNDVALDNENNVYVSEVNNNRVQEFDENGKFLSKWGMLGTSINQFTTPFSLCVDASDNVYVVDYNNRVQKFSFGYTYVINPNPVGLGQTSAFLFNFVSPLSYSIDVQSLTLGTNLFHFDGWGVAGNNKVTWNTNNVSNGVYLATFKSGNTNVQNTITVAK